MYKVREVNGVEIREHIDTGKEWISGKNQLEKTLNDLEKEGWNYVDLKILNSKLGEEKYILVMHK